MGQPIKLKKGKEETTVYGMAQLGVMRADGWKLATDETTPEPAVPIVEEKPAARSSPAKKK